MLLAAGTLLGRFEIVGPIGAGGMGDVYAARDPRLHRTVAIKVCREEFSERFEREARAVAALNHPNICTLHDIGQNYLVMELVEGATLSDRIATGPIPPTDAIPLARQVAEALKAAHDHRIVHRDLKPSNIKITPAGIVKVLDFGLARTVEDLPAANAVTITGSPRTVDGLVVGTVAYMSPEQAEGLPVDQRTDLWSFGIVLYQMLSRRTPFEGGTTQRTIVDILQKPVPALPGIPRQLQRVIDRCLQKDRDARYPSADALIEDLAACSGAAQARTGVTASARRHPAAAMATLVLAVTLIGGSVWWLQRTRMQQWARRAVPEAHRLADAGEYEAAFRLATEAERHIVGDPALEGVWAEVSKMVSIATTPAGADVSWKPYSQPDSPWQPLGATPIAGRRVPATPMRLRISKAGYAPLEVAAPQLDFSFTLTPEDRLPPDMVAVPGGARRAQYAGIGELAAAVGPFAIDRHEVTNRQFKEFIDRGGYRNRSVLEGAVRRERADADVGIGDRPLRRSDRQAWPLDLGSRRLPGRPGRPSGHWRELVRSGGLCHVRRTPPPHRASLVPRRQHRRQFLSDSVQQFRRHTVARRGRLPRAGFVRDARHGRQRPRVVRERSSRLEAALHPRRLVGGPELHVDARPARTAVRSLEHERLSLCPLPGRPRGHGPGTTDHAGAGAGISVRAAGLRRRLCGLYGLVLVPSPRRSRQWSSRSTTAPICGAARKSASTPGTAASG